MFKKFNSKLSVWAMNRTIGQLTALSVCVSLIVLLLVAGVHYRSQISGAFANDASNSQEPFSELYFTNFKLAQHYLKNNVQTPYSFAIANQSTKPVTYHYSVILTHGLITTLIAEGIVELDAGQKVIKTVNITSIEPDQQYRLVVKLLDQNQEINLRLQS